MATVREIAETYLKTKVLAKLDVSANRSAQGGKQLWSDKDEPVFTDLTREDLGGFPTMQAKLEANWKKPGQFMTTCLSFVLTYAKHLGYQMKFPGGFMASFEVATALARCDMGTPGKPRFVDKSHAWVPFGGKKRPGYGDVVLFKHNDNENHIGISLGVAADTDSWETAESGQGGPALKHDAIEKFTQQYLSRAHLGWVDIDLYFNGPPKPQGPQGTTGSLWINDERRLVHPNAPDGGGGPGYFRHAGVYAPDDGTHGLPHPSSPASRKVSIPWYWPGESPEPPEAV